MMRSLWSGVTGLQSHQIAMDVEGHNIANVNTRGYKYTKMSFADQISQTSEAATPPRDNGGGTNPKQVGLGTQGQAISRVFKQGSFEDSDVPTDLAIKDEGFFILSPDGGRSYLYTRNGEFKFDAQGNFVSNAGLVVQGWMRDKTTNLIDKTVPIQNIVIPKGLKTEAKMSTYMSLKGNLDSGNSVGKNIQYISSLDSFKDGYDKDKSGVIDPKTPPALPTEEHSENSTTDFMFDKNQKIVEAGLNASVLFNGSGESLNIREGQGIWTSFKDAISEQTITANGDIAPTSFKLNGTTINIQTTVPTATTNKIEYNAKKITDTINEYTSKTGVVATANGAKITLKNDNRIGTTDSAKNLILTGAPTAIGMADANEITAYKYKYSLSTNASDVASLDDDEARTFTTTEDLRQLLQADANKATAEDPKMDVTVNKYGQFQIRAASDSTTKPKLNISTTSYSDDKTPVNSKLTTMLQGLDGEISQVSDVRTSQSFYTTTNASEAHIYDSLGTKHSLRIEYTKVNITSQNGTEWRVKITVAEPGKLTHEKVREDNNDDGVITGLARFDATGAITSFSPTNIFFTPKNGADANQNIKLDVGTIGKYDGMTSYDADTDTPNSTTDGYAGGDLSTTEIAQDGTVVGVFTNGKRINLAQITTAKFTNNEGLENVGGNNFVQTSNSGTPIIGAAGTGGRGVINAGHLEMSNVDLSRSLTQLIVVQRGFQANSKTITTSDQMLNTLLQLKQ